MRLFNVLFFAGLLLAPHAHAETHTINIGSGDVTSEGSVLTIETGMPPAALGMRISRAILEVAIDLGESENDAFNGLPVVELYEDGSETPMQTELLEPGLNGAARFNVTRFVRDWADSNTRVFIVGAVSEDNDTVVQLGSVAEWGNGTKARLIIEYQDRDGTSVVQE